MAVKYNIKIKNNIFLIFMIILSWIRHIKVRNVLKHHNYNKQLIIWVKKKSLTYLTFMLLFSIADKNKVNEIRLK